MTGTEMVDLVIEHAGAEVPRAKAISAVNAAQNDLLGIKRLRLMRVLPDPFLTTVAGTFQYAASSALFSSVGGVKGVTQWDIRDIGRLFAMDEAQGYLPYAGYGAPSFRPLEPVSPGNSPEVDAPAELIPSKEPLSQDASIVFWEDNDPGTTTITWRAEAYRWPTQFTGEGVALEVPAGYHRTLLLWKVLQLFGIRQYGAPSRNIEDLIAKAEPLFYLECNRAGGVSAPRRTPPREL